MKIKLKKDPKHHPSGTSKIAPSAMQLAIAGRRLLETGRLEESEQAWRRAVQVDSRCVSAWGGLIDLLLQSKRVPEAAECMDHLVKVTERSASNLMMYAESYFALAKPGQARALLAEAIRADPSIEVRARMLLAKASWNGGDWEATIAETSRILELEPDNLEALDLRSRGWGSLSRVAEEIADLQRYIAIRPHCEVHSRLLFKLNYLPETTPESLFEESRRWNRLYAAPLAAEIGPHANRPDPDRRLKIGYVSPDLYNHTIVGLMAPIFENHDQRNFELFIYAIGVMPDDVTESLQRAVKNFVLLPPSEAAIAERVRTDGIDILIDLAGHTMHTSAYLAFALKPAPVQVSWHGALATTGLDTIDYFIGDSYMPFPGTEHLFSEKVYRLSGPIGSYRPAVKAEIQESPYFRNGYITFGCFNYPHKLNRDVILAWSAILHVLPTAKLFLKYHRLETDSVQARLLDWFHAYGIGGDRLIFEGRSKRAEYFEAWNKVDIALDPFPYNGGTTSLDSLWMGVPLVTLSGRLAVNCVGNSLLSTTGFPVARTAEEYIAHAVALANTIPAAPDIRQQVHAAIRSSPLLDEAGSVRSIEAAYRDMWRIWCASQVGMDVSDNTI